MARLFDDASSQYLSYAGTVLTAFPFTIAAWFRSDDTSADQEIFCIADTAGDNNYFSLRARGSQAADPVGFIAKDAASESIASTSTGYTANTWAHACGVSSLANSRTVYINGGSSGSNANSRVPGGLDTTSIGRLTRLNPINYFSGDLGEIALWNVALTAAEVAILAAGYSPLFVRPQSLSAYWPLFGYSSPELDVLGSAVMTVTGATASNHPRIIYPNRQKLFAPVTIVAASSFPPLRRHPMRHLLIR